MAKAIGSARIEERLGYLLYLLDGPPMAVFKIDAQCIYIKCKLLHRSAHLRFHQNLLPRSSFFPINRVVKMRVGVTRKENIRDVASSASIKSRPDR